MGGKNLGENQSQQSHEWNARIVGRKIPQEWLLAQKKIKQGENKDNEASTNILGDVAEDAIIIVLDEKLEF